MGKRIAKGSDKVAIGYVRCSTTEQHLSPAAQRSAIEVWAAREGVCVAAWHVDTGVSGSTAIEERPGLCGALAALREHGAGILVVARRDRIARDVLVSALVEREAEKAGARLLSADGAGNGDTDADMFMREIDAARAAYERRLIRSRTRAALAVKKARHECVGTAPYGFRVAADGTTLECDEAEQGVLAVVRELRAAGLSTRKIAEALTTRGLLSRAGTPFRQTSVVRMLRAVG